ncbi:MAG TPA: sensor histidine kinase [Gaiellaceae bacterium]|jgi:signal transduction histidine kinase
MIWRWLNRHPRLIDLALMAAVLLPTAGAAWHRRHSVAGVLLGALETLPLLFRRRRPVATVIAVGVVAIVIGASGLLLLPFQLGVALYTLAASSGPRRTRALGGFAAIAGTAAILAVQRSGPGDTALRVVFLTAAWLLGDSIGSRRAYIREIEAKADRLERERDIEARRAIAEEQARIARELHDVVAHALSVIVIQAGAAEELFELEPARARKPIRAIDAAARTALSDLRRVLGLLHADVEYQPQPGLSRLDNLIDQVRATGLDVALEIDGRARPLPAPVDLSAYRIIQEALTNTIKHAGAGHARVSVRYGDDLRLEIADDGHGATGDPAAGNGLTGMQQRAAMLGGEVETGTQPDGGYLVSARLPLGEP